VAHKLVAAHRPLVVLQLVAVVLLQPVAALKLVLVAAVVAAAVDVVVAAVLRAALQPVAARRNPQRLQLPLLLLRIGWFTLKPKERIVQEL
jgi:hypothetical protein